MQRFTILLFLFSLAGGLTAQDTQTLVQRNHYPAEQFDAAVKASEAGWKLLREHGAYTPVTAWVFDDNTIEYVWELESSAGFDLINDEYNAARMRIGEERIKEMIVPATKKEFWLGDEIDELSYIPEGTDLSEMGFIHVIRARIKTDDLEEFYRVAAEEAQLAKEQNRQTPFYLEMYPMGLGMRTFEVVEFGKDRADWERREAASKPHYDSKEYKAWAKKRDAVAEVISTRTAVRHEEMSLTAPEDEEQTAYLLVDEYQVAAGKMEDVLRHRETVNELSHKYYYAQPSHFATTHDERTLMRFVNLKNLAELERLHARGKQMRHAPADARERVRSDNKGLFTANRRYLLAYQDKYSYRPAGQPTPPRDEPNVWRMNVYEYEMSKGREVYELLSEIKAAYAAANSPIDYRFFSPTLGGAVNQFYIVTFAKDEADLRRRTQESNTALGARAQELQGKLDRLTSVVRRTSGVTHFDRRYTPRVGAR